MIVQSIVDDEISSSGAETVHDCGHRLKLSIKSGTAGTCEVSFAGTMTEPHITQNEGAIETVLQGSSKRAFIDMIDVSDIDDHGIRFLLRLMKLIERKGIRFQLLYESGHVGSKLEASGVTSYFAKPTWAHK